VPVLWRRTAWSRKPIATTASVADSCRQPRDIPAGAQQALVELQVVRDVVPTLFHRAPHALVGRFDFRDVLRRCALLRRRAGRRFAQARRGGWDQHDSHLRQRRRRLRAGMQRELRHLAGMGHAAGNSIFAPVVTRDLGLNFGSVSFGSQLVETTLENASAIRQKDGAEMAGAFFRASGPISTPLAVVQGPWSAP